ncbi:outer membrane beta-barrel protein [Sulfuricurvum sp.]|uniref:outer membrane beta-barrel protein n=1 Tax=Sulfuricurvum sp. TaxID=2025608 RepID=UPI002E357E3B|nr:hypothetical protein [Sulfuricurvum sp.]HEX5329075.1 hypothetical protein [Sulfuricurvum sp.]
MKKIVFSLLLACGLMASETGFYVGIDVGKANNSDKSTAEGTNFKYSNDYKDIKLKLGLEADEVTNIQLTYTRITYDNGVFYGSTGTTLQEVGIDLIKEFEVTSSIFPFLKIGLGYGKMDSEHSVMGSVNEMSSNIGAGLSVKLIDHVSAHVGADYVYRHWNNVSDGSFVYETRGSAIKPYVGLNFEF